MLIKEIFNASYIVENDLKVRFNNFESAGYLSVELVSKEIETLEKNCNIVLELKRNDTVIEKINLFTKILRPKLGSVFVPEEIRITTNGSDFEVENPIRLLYEGIGRIVVHIESSENSELSINVPTEIQEVMDRFNVDFNLCLDELKSKYPQYEQSLTSLQKNISLDDIESELEVYSNVFRNDVNFTTDFSEKFAWAVTRNYAMLDDYIITPFIEYIRSSPLRTIYLINPIWHINFFKAPKSLNLKIEYFDLKKNVYEPIEISTKLVGETDDSIDLYRLFKWELA